MCKVCPAPHLEDWRWYAHVRVVYSLPQIVREPAPAVVVPWGAPPKAPVAVPTCVPATDFGTPLARGPMLCSGLPMLLLGHTNGSARVYQCSC